MSLTGSSLLRRLGQRGHILHGREGLVERSPRSLNGVGCDQLALRRSPGGCIPVRCEAGTIEKTARVHHAPPGRERAAPRAAVGPDPATASDAANSNGEIAVAAEPTADAFCRHLPAHMASGEMGLTADPTAEVDDSDSESSPPVDTSCSAVLMRIAGTARIFRGMDHGYYAEVPIDGHYEIHELGSPAFEYWLIRSFRAARNMLPGSDSVKRLVRGLEAEAAAMKTAEAVWIRVADKGRATQLEGQAVGDVHGQSASGAFGCAAGDDVYFLDLGDSSRKAVEISAHGCRIVPCPPVAFRRPKGLAPLPVPRWDGSTELLRKYTNLTDNDFPLLVAWATYAFRPAGPYPVLILTGEQGSAKSTMARLLRALIDPSSAPLRALPSNQRDFMIEAHNTWLLAYDNVSSISNLLSDGLCRVATGGGLSTRVLFSDDDNLLFNVQRPTILTGIDDFVRRSDLIDRCLFVLLAAIIDVNRRSERAFWDDFAADYPRILGALLLAVSAGLRALPDVELPALPRMADFAQWGEAVTIGLGGAPGAFLAAYTANRREACVAALEGCPIAEALLEVTRQYPRDAQGSATEIYEGLSSWVPPELRRSARWPRSPQAFAQILRRMAPQLRAIGINVTFDRTTKARLIRIIGDRS